jgi:hypothetical protein
MQITVPDAETNPLLTRTRKRPISRTVSEDDGLFIT